MDIALTISNRQISPAVVNLFQFENGTTTLNFTLDSYMYGEVNLRNYKAYAITSINGNIDMTELVANYDASKDKLTLSWDVKEFTLLEAGAVVYQIVFKEATASGIPDEGENTAVFYTYKAILINRESIDADNEIAAKYPTILKQWLDRMNAQAELHDVGTVYMKYGESILPADRLAGKLYFQYTDTLNTRGHFEDEKGNILGEYDVVHLVGNESISGEKTFTISPKVPTPAAGDNSTKIATTAFVNTKAANFLPLAGGTMTGNIVMSGQNGYAFGNGAKIRNSGSNNENITMFLKDSDWKSSYVGLQSGMFAIYAGDGTNVSYLVGKTDGTLTWDGKNIALDANVLHKTGNETISGQKTWLDGSIWKRDDIDITQNPTSSKYTTWSQVCDKNYSALSFVETSYLTDGTVQQTIGARKEINGTKHTASLSLRIDSSGNKTFALSDNPPSSSNGAQIATTAWANAKFLPKTGGAMTVYKAMYRDVNDSYLALYGGTGNNDGAQLDLCGANHSSMGGMFQLHARNADVDMVLRGRPDGMLLWDTKYVLNNSFTMTTDGGAIMLTAATQAANGAYLRMYGKDHSSGAGTFNLAASNGTVSKVLAGKPNGDLTWDGKKIAVLVAEQKATSSNNYTWYRKYSDGWVEQGGRQNIGGGNSTVTFPIAMADKDSYDLQLTVIDKYRYACVASTGGRTATSIKVSTGDDSSANDDGTINWRVCGYAAS